MASYSLAAVKIRTIQMSRSSSVLLTLGDLLEELRYHLEQIADAPEVGQLEDRGLRVLVNGDDRLRGLHAGPVLDRAGNADRHVQLRRDGLAGLADLELVRVPPGIGDRAGRADGRVERIGQRLDDLETHGPSGATPAGDHDRRLGQVGTL